MHNLNYPEDSTKQEIHDVTLSNTGLILKRLTHPEAWNLFQSKAKTISQALLENTNASKSLKHRKDSSAESDIYFQIESSKIIFSQ